MNNNTKKTLLIIALVVIALALVILLINVLNKKNDKTNDTTKKDVNQTVDANDAMYESNALIYIDSVEKQVMLNAVESSIPAINEGTYEIDSLALLGVETNGEKPSMGVVTIDNKGAVSEAWLEFGEKKVYYNSKDKAKVINEFPDKTTANCVVTNDNGAITNNCN